VEQDEEANMKADRLKITTVSENTAGRPGLLAEWGICVLVEAEDRTYLVDTGSSSSVAHNLDALHVEVDAIDAVILSHGHFDHTGGLSAILSKRKKKPLRIIAHPAVWDLKYGGDPDKGRYHYAGIPFRPEALESQGARFDLTAEPTWLTEDIAAGGEEPMVTDFESVDKKLFVKVGTGYRPDSLADDQSLYIRTDLGLVIVLGCAHRGIINIIKHAQSLMDTSRVYMVLGGTHLLPASESRIKSTIDALIEMDVRWIGVSHCTGQKVAAKLDQAFPDRFFYNSAGTVLAFPFGG
jgi:7,8-dihydropterin-6-yl-methyl-4-(beta-D-ribofuranosyl)aminobenzene 5'-phosphate synthase